MLPIDGTIISTTNSDQSRPESNSNKKVLFFHTAPKQEHHHQMHLNIIPIPLACDS